MAAWWVMSVWIIGGLGGSGEARGEADRGGGDPYGEVWKQMREGLGTMRVRMSYREVLRPEDAGAQVVGVFDFKGERWMGTMVRKNRGERPEFLESTYGRTGRSSWRSHRSESGRNDYTITGLTVGMQRDSELATLNLNYVRNGFLPFHLGFMDENETSRSDCPIRLLSEKASEEFAGSRELMYEMTRRDGPTRTLVYVMDMSDGVKIHRMDILDRGVLLERTENSDFVKSAGIWVARKSTVSTYGGRADDASGKPTNVHMTEVSEVLLNEAIAAGTFLPKPAYGDYVEDWVVGLRYFHGAPAEQQPRDPYLVAGGTATTRPSTQTAEGLAGVQAVSVGESMAGGLPVADSGAGELSAEGWGSGVLVASGAVLGLAVLLGAAYLHVVKRGRRGSDAAA